MAEPFRNTTERNATEGVPYRVLDFGCTHQPRYGSLEYKNASMPSITTKALALLVRPWIIHSLPGRLRVHVPFLKTAVRENPAGVKALVNLAKALPGIEALDWSSVTGNVLIRYDAARLGEAELLEFLRVFTNLYLGNRRGFDALGPEQIPKVAEKLATWISETVKDGNIATIPDKLPGDIFPKHADKASPRSDKARFEDSRHNPHQVKGNPSTKANGK
uniref:Uncharacterized protein n=1 Tax=Candidatus Kentrum sp. FW TaxID=2126338 RepID=A0A450TA31_9GAMM|nr:MAG: hypothetical protein BECKFW1821A_GA0114235_10902 [Candidatus Kentron sp. FW]VFJ63528.1 MAG: hypothetical protein BECKFW1821B_GA0114236_108411 [Candidatus Kentron sp. FW]